MTHLTIQQLVAQTDGELSGPSLQLVEKHISECESCWHEMEQIAEMDALLESVVSIDPGDAFFDDLAANVEAEISGKKKPAPRAAAPQPASPPPVVSPAPPAPEVPPALPVPPAPEVSPAPPAPVPDPIASFDRPRDAEPAGLIIQSIGAWTPPTPTPDDPFADLVLPPRSAAVPPSPVVAPRPLEIKVTRPDAAPRPVPEPVPAPAAPAPPRVQSAPAAPTPPRVQSAPAVPTPPRVKTPPAAPAALGAEPDGRRKLPMAPILIGVCAFIAGIVVAAVITVRLLGFGGIAAPHPRGSVPPAAQPVSEPTVTESPEPAPEAEAPPTVQVEVPPAVIPTPAARPAPIVAASSRPKAFPTPPRSSARTPRHAPAAGSTPGRDIASESSSTTVIPEHIIRTEAAASTAPAAPAPPPAAPAPQAELGILCGTVRDSDGHPVARAQVMMADVGVVVLTDRVGGFCLTAPAGERTLSVVALGFSPARRLVSLGKRTPEISITLKSAAPFPTPH